MACARRLQLQYLHYLTLISLLSPAAFVSSTTPNVSLPGCPDKCGNITIPYPFGTRPECCRDGFNITCSESTNPSKAFLGSESSNIELIDININHSEARVYNYITYRCYNQSRQIYSNSNEAYQNISSFAPFLFSNRRNKFTAIGCYTLAYMKGPPRESNQSDSAQQSISGCVSYCMQQINIPDDGGLCSGLGCCQTSIPAGLNYYEVWWGYDINFAWSFNPCTYAVLVEEDWYKFQRQDLSKNYFLTKNPRGVPFVLDWAIRDNGTCLDSDKEKRTHSACLSENSRCYNTSNGDGYICNCTEGYEGNPYLSDGCTDINECEKDPCKDGTCINTEGSYQCECPKGTKGDGKTEPCNKIPEKFPYPARVAICSILSVAILLGLCFLVATHQENKRHIKEIEEYERYYQMMNKHLPVFSKKQIEVATNNFAEIHVLGRGGQGNVYKGLIENNQIVAIKKAKELEERKIEEFVNEIILLSQINHKNIVRLLGCCVEDKIPMLVYEFFPNGTLFELLHRNSSGRPISLGTRLKIALDSATALDYLHSSISPYIIHGDVKSANILLDANYTAKVSDFGASSAVPVNEIVMLAYYSDGYVDPECFSTKLITKQSDVYSFGVVMLELLTRKEAVYKDEKKEKQPLATSFLSKARKNKHLKMLDEEIVTNDENVMKVLEVICEIALQCLSPEDDRPTMEQVVDKLQNLVKFHNSSPGHQIDQGEMESLLGKFPYTSDASSSNSTQYSAVLEISTGGPR